ncbi:MAG: hydrolase [Chloroflexota bacterium]|nr:hydrolase [Chloroflexota bacterium]
MLMQPTRLALIQTHWPGDRVTLMETYRTLVAEAAGRGAQLVCLPEFSLSPYFAYERAPVGFAWAEPLTGGVSEQFFSELAETYNVTLVGSLFERDAHGGYWDTATVHNPAGQLIGFTRKVHIPAGVGYYESDYYPGADDFPVHDLGRVKLAVPTCYDQWFPELARIYALNGADLIFYPTAIGSEPNAPDIDSQSAWQTVMRGHAIANGLFVAAANRTGAEGPLRFYGSSFICDPMGNILAQAGRGSSEVISADLDPQVLKCWRELFPLLHQRRPAVYKRLLDPVDMHGAPPWLVEEQTP